MSLPDGSELLKDIEKVIERKQAREQEDKLAKPITQLEEVKQNRAPVGKGKMILAGVPVDLFTVEDFVIKASGTDVDSLLSFDRARMAEMIRNNERPTDKKSIDFNWTILLFIIIAAAAGLLIFMFLPKIMDMFGGLF